MGLKFSLLYLIAIFAIYGSFALKINAQSINGVLVDMVPSTPAPYGNTTINLKSYENNLDSVLISWSVDGKTMISAIGKKSFSVTAPAAGVTMNIVATISLPDGTIETKIEIRPSVMVLLWQANDSYVPPFYRGKALPSPQSEVKVVAMPEIKSGSGNISPQNMTYSWQTDYNNNVDGSGYGKNSFAYVNDYLEDSNTISVTASTVDQSSSVNGSIDIGTIVPKILLYKKDIALGTLWQNTLPDTYKIQGPEIIEAIPYFVSPKQIINPALVWNWSINDIPVTVAGYNKNLMPLQVQAGTHGTSKLDLQISNTDKIFQTTSKEINIEF